MSQIIGDNNWETDTLFFIDDFSVDGRTWSNNFIDNRNLWRAYSTEAGVTHGKNEHQVYQKENCIFDDTNNLMKLVSKKLETQLCNVVTILFLLAILVIQLTMSCFIILEK